MIFLVPELTRGSDDPAKLGSFFAGLRSTCLCTWDHAAWIILLNVFIESGSVTEITKQNVHCVWQLAMGRFTDC